MRDAGVTGPVAREFADEGDNGGFFGPPNFFGKMGEELEWGHHFVVGVFVAEGDVVDLLEDVDNEEPASVLGGMDAVLVVKAGVPERLDFSLFPRFGVSDDQWIVFVEGIIVLVEQCRYPRLILVDHIRENKTGDFYGFRTGKADQETRLEEDFLDSSKVVVLWLADDWGESLNGGLGFGGYV